MNKIFSNGGVGGNMVPGVLRCLSVVVGANAAALILPREVLHD